MKQPIIPYRSDLTAKARQLRRKLTLTELLLWHRLSRKKVCGYDFDRQRPLGRRIVDFYCKELQLAVDVDGSVHDHTRTADEFRQREIEALGVTLLRFWNAEVKTDLDSVIRRIEEWIRAEESRRGWPKREPPVLVRRSRATRRRQRVSSVEPTPDPSQEGSAL